MKKLERLLNIAWITTVFLTVFRDDFPTLLTLYFIMTFFSALFGFCCIFGAGYAPAWGRRGVPKETQKKAARVMGALFLVNAAVCPLGWLLARFVKFDTDFILLTQIVGFPVVCILGLFPCFLARKQFG